MLETPAPPLVPGSEIDGDQLRALARQLVEDGPDNQSAVAERIGVHRSSVSRALNDPSASLDDVLRRIVGAYTELKIGEPRTVFPVLAKGGLDRRDG